MEAYKGDTPLFIKTGENNLEVRNYVKTDDNNESTPICKLNDFFSNNINFELSKISILQLENCDLHEIPSILQKLNLKQLILTRNKLKEIPSCLYSGMNALELLDLSHNFLESFDIEPACSCTIITLKINDNKIKNLPHWILNLRCPKLEEVVYSNNCVIDLRASHHLNIKKLEMCNCQLLDVDFQFFKSLKDLEDLNISNSRLMIRNENNFKNIDHLFVNPKWTNLKILNLSNHTVSILPKGIFWIVSLTELHLSNCDLSWIPSDIQYLTNLRLLDISYNTICSLPPELTSLKQLGVIKAQFNSISSIADFSHNLETLDLYNNWLEANPACASNAKFIDLEQNYFATIITEDYEQKRDQLRKMYSYSRINGCKEPPEAPIYCEGLLSHKYSDSESSVQYEDHDSDSDNWDEEKPVITKQKNPEITSSDDEWDGRADLVCEKQKVKKIEFEEYEEWIFCDAQE